MAIVSGILTKRGQLDCKKVSFHPTSEEEAQIQTHSDSIWESEVAHFHRLEELWRCTTVGLGIYRCACGYFLGGSKVGDAWCRLVLDIPNS
jgi:hypothetical protein